MLKIVEQPVSKELLQRLNEQTDEWCKVHGRGVDDYCAEHDHTVIKCDGLPPRWECLVCGEVLPRDEPLIKPSHFCGVCGQPCSKDVLSPKRVERDGENVNVMVCPKCLHEPAQQLTEADAAAGLEKVWGK